MSRIELEKLRTIHWRYNKSLMVIIGSVWFVVSLGCGILWVNPMNTISFWGFKMGFWFAQQGAIYFFILLTWVYAFAMARIEKRLGLEEEQWT